MSEKEIQSIAAERIEVTKRRDYLESRKAMLEKGLETFREAMSGLRH
jgi:hypothetical protein